MPYSPTADIGLYQSSGTRGLIGDVLPSPAGDVVYVTGVQRLMQDIQLWILTPQGTRFTDPGYGNPLWGLIGQPMGDLGEYGAMVDAAEQAFIASQAVDVSAGTLSLDEQVSSIQTTSISNPSPSTIAVAFIVYSRAGTQAIASVTLPT